MKIELTGEKEIRAAFAALVPRIQEKAVARLAQKVFSDVVDGADSHTKTGSLHQSVQLRKTAATEYVVYHDSQIAPYWRFVHWGAKPHVIRPNRKKVLRWPSGNGFMFAKFVNHPGYKGDPYMVKAMQNAPRYFEQIIKSIGTEV